MVSREAWPRSCWTSTTLAPPSRAVVAKVWRRAWTRAPGGTGVRMPARFEELGLEAGAGGGVADEGFEHGRQRRGLFGVEQQLARGQVAQHLADDGRAQPERAPLASTLQPGTPTPGPGARR